MADALLEIRDLTYAIGGPPILPRGNLPVGDGETDVLLGRSGSGKTTLLKAVNGLVTPTGGEIRFEGKSTAEWDRIRMRRRMGYVIQSAGLFPHWTVEANVAMVPRLEKRPESEVTS